MPTYTYQCADCGVAFDQFQKFAEDPLTECQTCHGQIQKMDRVRQFASLNMGWCVSCHVNGYSAKEGIEAAGYEATPATAAPATVATADRKKARYDCANCHY